MRSHFRFNFVLFSSTLVVSFLFGVVPVFAAEMRLNPLSTRVSVNQEFDVEVRVDAPQEEINALQGTLQLPTDLVTPLSIRDGSSIVSFWVDRPILPSNGASAISFSGIIPGGYQDTNGFLFAIHCQATKEGRGKFNLSDVKILLNDGKGTEAPVKLTMSEVAVLATGSTPPPVTPSIMDAVPPEPFTPQVIRDPNLYDGKWLLVFATQDKGVGMDYYEVREGNAQQGSWVRAESPYVLQDQSLSREISVRAIDRFGNMRVETLAAIHPFPPLSYLLWIISAIIAAGVILLIVFIVRVRRRRH